MLVLLEGGAFSAVGGAALGGGFLWVGLACGFLGRGVARFCLGWVDWLLEKAGGLWDSLEGFLAGCLGSFFRVPWGCELL